MTARLYAGPIEALNAALVAAAVLTAWVAATPHFAGSVAVGAVLEAVNFRSLKRNCLLAAGGAGNASAMAMAGFALRFTVLLIAIGASLHFGAHPIGLLIGLSTIVPAVLLTAWRARPEPAADAPALSVDDPEWDAWNPWLARESEIEEDA